MKKLPNPVGTEEEKSSNEDNCFGELLLVKNLLT